MASRGNCIDIDDHEIRVLWNAYAPEPDDRYVLAEVLVDPLTERVRRRVVAVADRHYWNIEGTDGVFRLDRLSLQAAEEIAREVAATVAAELDRAGHIVIVRRGGIRRLFAERDAQRRAVYHGSVGDAQID